VYVKTCVCTQTEPCARSVREQIRGHDLVSGPQKLEFLEDPLICQGVRLWFAPSFFGYIMFKLSLKLQPSKNFKLTNTCLVTKSSKGMCF
jgi:hypothetical protein